MKTRYPKRISHLLHRGFLYMVVCVGLVVVLSLASMEAIAAPTDNTTNAGDLTEDIRAVAEGLTEEQIRILLRASIDGNLTEVRAIAGDLTEEQIRTLLRAIVDEPDTPDAPEPPPFNPADHPFITPPQANGGVFDFIDGYFRSGDKVFMFLDGAYILEALLPVFSVFGSIVLMILWSINVAKGTTSIATNDMRGLIRAVVTLPVTIILMSASYGIMALINRLFDLMTRSVFKSFDTQLTLQQWEMVQTYAETGWEKLPIIGPLLSWLSYLWSGAPLAIYNIFMLVSALIIGVTIATRLVKLAMYQGIAPFVIAFGASDITRSYARNFVSEYLVVGLQLPIMAVFFGIAKIAMTASLNTMRSVETFTIANSFPTLFIICSLILMITKAEKWLRQIFH